MLSSIGRPLRKFSMQSSMPEIVQKRMPEVRINCIRMEMPSVLCVLYTCHACGTWQMAMQMPAMVLVTVKMSRIVML